MITAWLCWMSCRSRTVTELPIRSRGVGARLATTTTSPSEVSGVPVAVWAMTMTETNRHGSAVAAAANGGFTAELPLAHDDPSNRAGERWANQLVRVPTTRPGNAALVATRVVPLVQHAPAARLGDHAKQVSWLAA